MKLNHVFQIKYKENYMKNKEKAVGVNMSDSKTLHSLQVAKMSSDVSIHIEYLLLHLMQVQHLSDSNMTLT